MASLYPLDPTGTNPNNLVSNDVFAVTPNQNTAIIPSAGMYYASTLIVKDSNTGNILTRNVDYISIELSGEQTAKYGQELTGAVLFLGTNGTTSVTLTYQCLGSEYGAEIPQLQTLLENVTATTQQLQWYNILNKPTLYEPNNHINMLEDIFGFEPVVYAIERLTNILKIGNTDSFELLMQWVTQQFATTCYQAMIRMYNMVGGSTIEFNPTIESNAVNNKLTLNNIPNGLVLQWSMSNEITNVSNDYFIPNDINLPISPNNQFFKNNGILICNNIESNNGTFSLNFTATNGLIPGTNLILSIDNQCVNSDTNIVIGWYSYNNGFPDNNEPNYSLSDRSSYMQSCFRPTSSKTFRSSFTTNRTIS